MLLQKVSVLWAIPIALIATLLPSAIVARPGSAKGILVDIWNRAMVPTGPIPSSQGSYYVMLAYYDRKEPKLYFNTSWQSPEIYGSNTGFPIISKLNGLCVTADATGGTITQQNCAPDTTNAYQLWKYHIGESYKQFTLQNVQTQKCMSFGSGGSVLVEQKTCPSPLLWTLSSMTWSVEQFARVPNPGALQSVSTGQCFTRGVDKRYYLKPCIPNSDTQNQALWIWDNTVWAGEQPWYGSVVHQCTSSSDADYRQIMEVDIPSGSIFTDVQKWTSIGNVDYQFQIKNKRGGWCLDAATGANGQMLKLDTCSGAPNTLWVRLHASVIMGGYGETCHGHRDCLSNSCSSPTDGTCLWGSTGDGCRKNGDCRSNKCRQGKCECKSHADETEDINKACRENVPADCCSGNCELNTAGVGVCGCHAFWQPCAVNGDCCSNTCDSVFKTCKCLVTGKLPATPFAIGSLGAGFISTPGLCCSGETDGAGLCGKGNIGTYCETNNDCKGNICNAEQNTCSCGSSDCTSGGDAHCKSCFGARSLCYLNHCCYDSGTAVPCNTRTGSNGHADNAACCDERCSGSGASCASGRTDTWCSQGGPTCITRESEKGIFGFKLDFGD